jgi:hypothetical protein
MTGRFGCGCLLQYSVFACFSSKDLGDVYAVFGVYVKTEDAALDDYPSLCA